MPLPKTCYPINDLSDFRAWMLDHPRPAKLLKEILFRWRVSNMKVRGKPGPWAVYPSERWAGWSGLTLHQTKRALPLLELDNLILRELHRFAGSEVRAYLQPTSITVEFAG